MSDFLKKQIPKGRKLGRRSLAFFGLNSPAKPSSQLPSTSDAIQPLASSHHVSPPPAAPPLSSSISFSAMENQQQSQFFRLLSPELRICIYERILSDPGRFMHIMTVARDHYNLAHCWCHDEDSPSPSCQHHCYGDPEIDYRGDYVFQLAPPESRDGFVNFLISCRRIYHEALEILYTKNTFHFRGSPRVLAFYKSIPTPQWQAIRHLHMSTMFFHLRPDTAYIRYLPEDFLEDWEEVCSLLNALKLRSLRFDISHVPRRSQPLVAMGVSAMIALLEPLKMLQAEVFEVELNFQPPPAVEEYFKDAPFEVVFKERTLLFSRFADRLGPYVCRMPPPRPSPHRKLINLIR